MRPLSSVFVRNRPVHAIRRSSWSMMEQMSSGSCMRPAIPFRFWRHLCEVAGQPIYIQTLSYSPVRPQESLVQALGPSTEASYEWLDTVDTSRSQERYSNALVHTARMNTRRQLLERQAVLRVGLGRKA